MTRDEITDIIQLLEMNDCTFIAQAIDQKIKGTIYLHLFLDAVALRLDEFTGSEVKILLAGCLCDTWPDTRKLMDLTGLTRKTVLSCTNNRKVIDILNRFHHEKNL